MTPPPPHDAIGYSARAQPIMAFLQAIENRVAQAADRRRGGDDGRRLKKGRAGGGGSMRERALGAFCAPHKSSRPGMVESSDPTL